MAPICAVARAGALVPDRCAGGRRVQRLDREFEATRRAGAWRSRETFAALAVRLWLGAGFAAWMLTVGAGLTMLWAYAGTPGPPAAAPPAWPAARLRARRPASRRSCCSFTRSAPARGRPSSSWPALLAEVAGAARGATRVVLPPGRRRRRLGATPTCGTRPRQIPGVRVDDRRRRRAGACVRRARLRPDLLYGDGRPIAVQRRDHRRARHEGDNPGANGSWRSILAGGRPASTRDLGCYRTLRLRADRAAPSDDE